MNSQPKCLVLDIENFPMEAYVWERRDVNIGLDMLKQDWSIAAWSAKWLGKAGVEYYDTRKLSERTILIRLRDLLDEADIVITQNGQTFDCRKINARLIFYGILPPSPYRHLDTYRIAKRIASFTSFSLEYLADKLCTKYKKFKHSKFPGISLWKECLKGNIKAWDEMKRYNIRDTLTTEELYLKLQAWVPDTMPKPYSAPIPAPLHCDTCNYKGVMTKWGCYRTNHGMWARFSCPACGTFRKGAKL